MEHLMREFSEPTADHGAWEYDPTAETTRWSDALYAIHGVDREGFEVSEESALSLVHPDDRDMYLSIFRDAMETRTPFACQHRVVRPNGEIRNVIVRGSFVEGFEGSGDRLIGTTQDVTERAREDESLLYLSSHDSVSGLFNRNRFMEELAREIAAGRRNGMGGALLVLNLDRFADVNLALGNLAGDHLLRKVATVLRGRLRDTDTLARIGGDVFGMILPGCQPEAAKRVAAQLIEAISSGATVNVDGTERRAGGSIGMSFFSPTERRVGDELMVEAELAVMRAKANGRGQAQVFSEDMRAEQAVMLSTEDELRGAIGGQEIRVQYQPIVSLGHGGAIGCEALVRWDHPIRGMVAPGDFVSIAEETGLISKMGRIVLHQACRQAAQWMRQGRDLFVSVNLSARQLTRFDLAEDISNALLSNRLPAERLCLEVTETSLLRDPGAVVGSLRRLKALGVRLAVDDFGAGASSFGLLRILPIDQIKIDQSFIQGLGDTTSDRAVVAAVVSLAKELGLSVIAEGVETQRQQAELRDLGAELAQGFLYSPARYPEELDLDGLGNAAVQGAV